MLKVENISTGYGNKQVLYDVSFEVKKGEIVLLTGGNGSGKTTLLKCLFNLLPLWNGNVYFENKITTTKSSHNLVKKGIVYIPQKDYCFENLSVNENLKISGSIYPKNELNKRLELVYSQMNLSNLKKRKPFYLSGGERKLLAFGMAMMHYPKLILFDEPFVGIDNKKAQELFNIFRNQLNSSKIVGIIVEHKDTNKEFYKRKIIMELGKIKN